MCIYVYVYVSMSTFMVSLSYTSDERLTAVAAPRDPNRRDAAATPMMTTFVRGALPVSERKGIRVRNDGAKVSSAYYKRVGILSLSE